MSDFETRNSIPIYESISESARMSVQRSTRQSLNDRFDRECPFTTKPQERDVNSSELARSGTSWCDGFSLSIPTVNPRQALRNGAEKLTQTLNTVRTTFGTLSQKLRKSTRRRQPLKNVDSPKTPVTPYTRSKSVLGRTPTKLYSPFSIDTPRGKENARRAGMRKASPGKASSGAVKKKIRQKDQAKTRENRIAYSPGVKLANDLQQAQIGIYEFQLTANRIVRRSMRN